MFGERFLSKNEILQPSSISVHLTNEKECATLIIKKDVSIKRTVDRDLKFMDNIYCMLTKNSFEGKQDFMLRGFFHDQTDRRLHQQEFNEIVFVLGGSAKHLTLHSVEQISRGDILILPDKAYHGFYATENLKIFNLLFMLDQLPLARLWLLNHPGFKHLFGHHQDFYETRNHYPKIHLPEEEIASLEVYLRNIEAADLSSSPCRKAQLMGNFLILVSFLCEKWQETISPDQNIPLEIMKATEYLNSHYPEIIYLDDLAKITCMSKNTLLRNFKKATGVTPMEYLLQIRLSNACSMLLDTSLRINEIADQCGFTDMVFFSRTFRKKIGCTPSEYRSGSL